MNTRLCIKPVSFSCRMPVSTSGIAGLTPAPAFEFLAHYCASGFDRIRPGRPRPCLMRKLREDHMKEIAPDQFIQVSYAELQSLLYQLADADSSERCGPNLDVPSIAGKSLVFSYCLISSSVSRRGGSPRSLF